MAADHRVCTDSLFVLEGVERLFPGRPLRFKNVDHDGASSSTIRIPRGGMIGVLGLSGCGKSTLLSLVSLLDRADSGSIRFFPGENGACSIDLADLYDDDGRRSREVARRFGHIFQGDELLDHLSVEHNLQLRSWLRGESMARRDLESALAAIKVSRPDDDGIASYLDKNPKDLSVGERTRIGILRALLGSQEVIFADEPTANVDRAAELEILKLLSTWVNSGSDRTVLLCTHRLDLAWDYTDYFLVLQKEGTEVKIKQFHKKSKEAEKGTVWSRPIANVMELQAEILGEHGIEAEKPRLCSDARQFSSLKAALLLLWRDFWKHPRSESRFLVERMTPILYCFSFLVLLWLGSFFLGIQAGSEMDYESRLSDEFLWSTMVRGSANSVGTLSESVGQSTLRSVHGFHRWAADFFVHGTQDFADDRFRVSLFGQTIEDDDPLLERVCKTLLWPQGEAERDQAFFEFSNSGFGIIIAADFLKERLGYPEGHYPPRLAVRLRRNQYLWIPVFGVAPQLPHSADCLINTATHEAFQQPAFTNELLVSVFRLHPAGGMQSSDDLMEMEQVNRIEAWLRDLGLSTLQSEWKTYSGKRLLEVHLSDTHQEFELENLLMSEMISVADIAGGVSFPRILTPPRFGRDQYYNRWSIGLPMNIDKVREIIRIAYGLDIVIDTSVEARVASLQSGKLIFSSLARTLFFSILILGSVLLFVSNWLDGSRKIHSVGVMLGMGVTRRRLILGNLLQMYLLMGLVLGLYVLMDVSGANHALITFVDRTLFGDSQNITYLPFSDNWLLFIASSFVLVPGVICLLRRRLYRYQPAKLIQSKS